LDEGAGSAWDLRNTLVMLDVSARDQREHTMTIPRRAGAGEQLRTMVGRCRRPVAQLGPIEQGAWTSGQAMELVRRRAPSDASLLDDLQFPRGQFVE
jgi:hypothetical protein